MLTRLRSAKAGVPIPIGLMSSASADTSTRPQSSPRNREGKRGDVGFSDDEGDDDSLGSDESGDGNDGGGSGSASDGNTPTGHHVPAVDETMIQLSSQYDKALDVVTRSIIVWNVCLSFVVSLF